MFNIYLNNAETNHYVKLIFDDRCYQFEIIAHIDKHEINYRMYVNYMIERNDDIKRHCDKAIKDLLCIIAPENKDDKDEINQIISNGFKCFIDSVALTYNLRIDRIEFNLMYDIFMDYVKKIFMEVNHA